MNETIMMTASDVTAGAFLVVFIIMIGIRKQGIISFAHLLASAICVLTCILLRLSVLVPTIKPGLRVPSALWPLAFICCSLAIWEAMIHVDRLYGRKADRRQIMCFAADAIIISAGIITYTIIGDNTVFRLFIMAQIVLSMAIIYARNGRDAFGEFAMSVAAAVVLIVLTLVCRKIGVTTIGYAVMPTVLYARYLDHIEKELKKTTEDLEHSKVKLLAEQISPHYIYNSLQCIKGLCVSDPIKAGVAIDKFAGYLRSNLESLTEEGLITFRKELAYTRTYLELEQLAGNGEICVEYKLETSDFMLPPLTLQPVVENAVRYGGSKGGQKKITISSREEGGSVVIKVVNLKRDKGAAGNAQRGRKSIGLENVRMRLLLQVDGVLMISDTEDLTIVTIKMTKKVS